MDQQGSNRFNNCILGGGDLLTPSPSSAMTPWQPLKGLPAWPPRGIRGSPPPSLDPGGMTMRTATAIRGVGRMSVLRCSVLSCVSMDPHIQDVREDSLKAFLRSWPSAFNASPNV